MSGSSCYYCELDHYHPSCSAPGCENVVHGEGTTVLNYCESCREAAA